MLKKHLEKRLREVGVTKTSSPDFFSSSDIFWGEDSARINNLSYSDDMTFINKAPKVAA